MFNSKDIGSDKEVILLSFEQKINKDFTALEIIEGDLWKVYDNAGVYKCIPLFNCDIIRSSNSSDIVLDNNKCLILQNKADTIVSVSSDDTGSTHYYTVELYAFTPYTALDVLDELTVYCIVYDEYLNTINNVLVNVLVDDEIVGQVQTDNQGLCRYTVNEPCEIGFCYDETLSNTIMITGGE